MTRKGFGLALVVGVLLAIPGIAIATDDPSTAPPPTATDTQGSGATASDSGSPAAPADPSPDSASERDAFIESAEPAPNTDGDPTSIEGILPDGRSIVVYVSTADPSLYKGTDIDEYSEQDDPVAPAEDSP